MAPWPTAQAQVQADAAPAPTSMADWIYETTRTDAQNAVFALRNGAPVVPSQNYHDLYGSYRLDDRPGTRWSGLLSNVEILMSIKNVLDTKPPLVSDNSQGYFAHSSHGDPRLRSYAITLSKSFR